MEVQRREFPMPYYPNERDGLCHCGCGQLAPIARKNSGKQGTRKGKPQRYVRGHATRGKKLFDISGKRSAASSGRKASDETKRKMSLAHSGDHNPMFGKTHSLTARAKISQSLLGPSNPRWNDGASTKRQQWQASEEARAWRTSVFERDDHTCQECGVRGGDLHAHHINAWATHPQQRCDLLNGQTLCVPCHRLTKTYGRPTKVTAWT